MTDTSPNILIVEDELTIAEIISDYLKHSGFNVTHLDNGKDVVSLVKSNPPDLLLLDIMLPGANGLDICREIRKFSEVPIILVSARVEELDRLLGLELGADDYICKPFSPREVVARSKAVIRRFKRTDNEPLEEKLFSIEEEENRISVRGTYLDLTRTEFRLLKLMVSRPGRVFSRAQLLDLCYDQGDQVYDRVIDSHIKNLRRKVSRALPDKEVIHAVYGVGYRYEVQDTQGESSSSSS